MRRIDGKRPTKAAKRKRNQRLQVLLLSDELAAINDFRYRARMPSLAAAVRELLRRGLASSKTSPKQSN
jgi:hypothetical protein